MKINKFLLIVSILFISFLQIVKAPRIDNLNIVEYSSIIEIDTDNPTFNRLNLTRNGLVGNNTFISASILNFTINVSDKNNNTILAYVSNIKNITSGYVSNSTKNLTITFADGNYTLLLEINDSAGNKINGSYLLGFVVDTTAPTFISAFNRTADSSNSTTITTETDVNLTVYGVDDLYLDRGNFSENCTLTSRAWQNKSITINGNQTPYYQIINKTNFTAGQVCGWKFYFYDIAGNSLDPVYTFTIESVATPVPKQSSGEGSTSSVNIPQSLLNPFGTEPINEKCAEKEQLLDGRCYPCDPEIGYLEFNPSDRSVMCIKCEEGFKLENKQCTLKPPISPKDKLNAFIDNLAQRISQYLNMSILIGYIAVFIGFITIVYYGYLWLKK